MFNPSCAPSPASCGTPNWICLPVPPVPAPVFPPPALNGPIRGVINGAPAAPGNVGEFLQKAVTGSLTVAANALVTTTVTPLTLGPGDWNITAQLVASLLFSGMDFVLSPTLPGASGNMYSSIILPGVVHQLTQGTLQSPVTQLLTAAAATVLQFNIDVTNNTAASVTGTYTFTVTARRMR